MTLFRYLSALAMLLAPALLAAQSPRMVLIEEVTNASCPPCASQNPTFEHFLNDPFYQDIVIPIVYHSSYPGYDLMNAANPTMHNARSDYYPITGVPTAITNGRVVTSIYPSYFYPGAPSDTFTLSAEVAKARGTFSPLSIDVRHSFDGGNALARVAVHTSEAIDATVLRIAVVERHHYYANAGSNGERDFAYIARQMLPDHQGTPLRLDAGESATFEEEFTIDPEWNRDELYIVAFVQEPATRRVLQAGSSRTIISLRSAAPFVTLATSADGNSGTWTAALASTAAGVLTLNIDRSRLPAGWSAEVRIDGSTVASGQSVEVDTAAALPLEVAIEQGAGAPGVGGIDVTLHGAGGGSQTWTYRLYSGDFDVALISRDEEISAITASYAAALARAEVNFITLDPLDDPYLDISRFPVVIYQSGKWILTQRDVEQVKAYLDSGGRLLLAGAEIAWAIADDDAAGSSSSRDMAFLQDYLHADYVADTGPGPMVYGAPGDPVSHNMSFSIGTGYQNQNTPDVIAPRNGAVPIFYYGSTQSHVAGIRYEGNGRRHIYLGFGLEGIGDLAARTAVLGTGVRWLLGTLGVEEFEAATAGITLGSPRPNPAGSSAVLRLDLARSATVDAVLYDVRGVRYDMLTHAQREAGSSLLSLDVSQLPAGLYTVVVTVDGHTVTRPLAVLR